MNRWAIAGVVWTALSLMPAAWAAGRTISVSEPGKPVPLYHKVEFTIAGPIVCSNPYDPDEADIRLEITSPSGSHLWIPAFYCQPYERSDRRRGGGQFEWTYPDGSAQWQARFAPTEPGAYSVVASVKDRAGEARSAAVRFTCIPSEYPGFVHVSEQDPRYYVFDSDKPFFPVGQNVAFVHNGYAAIAKIRKLGDNGANYARVWACAEDWALAIESRKSAFGRSWDWNPPIVAMPGREGFMSEKLCLKLTGDAGAALTINPSHPVGLKPLMRYRLTGAIRADKPSDVTVDLGGAQTIAAKRGWSRFSVEYASRNDQFWLGNPAFRLKEKSTVYLSNLSLKEAGGSPELLWEADVNRPVLGVYNQPDCAVLDAVVSAAEDAGVYLQLTLLTRDCYMDDLSKEGSPAYARATEQAQKLLRYAVARWGYSTHIAAWEYFNEMDPGRPTNRFYTDLAKYLDQVDVNRHTRANSTWSSPSKDWHHPDLDQADLHFYLRHANGPVWQDSVASLLEKWKMVSQNVHGRPALCAEYGITSDNWQHAPELDRDKGFLHLHNGLWTSALCGFSGTVCHWFWDDIDRHNDYPLYRGISRYVADIPWTSAGLAPTGATADKGIRVVGLQSADRAYLWLNDPASTWYNVAINSAHPAQQANITLTIPDLKPRTYRIRWFDTVKGEVTASSQIKLDHGVLSLLVPAFTGDIALKVTP